MLQFVNLRQKGLMALTKGNEIFDPVTESEQRQRVQERCQGDKVMGELKRGF